MVQVSGGSDPWPHNGLKQFQCYEGMEISTCVSGKLNNIFVWKASGPSVIFVIVLLDCCYSLKIVAHAKGCLVNISRGQSPYVLSSLAAFLGDYNLSAQI